MIVKNLEKKENSLITFQVEVSKEEFEESVFAAYLKNKKTISVPGFRKGKAPRMVIEGMYGANVFYDDAIEDIGPKAFDLAVTENELKTVGQPHITAADVDDDKALLIAFECALYPEVTLGQYKGLEVPKEEINITDVDVDKYLDEIRQRNGRQSSVTRKAKLGDTVVIDYDGYLEGVRFDGGKAENHNLELGSGNFVPGFEDQLVGAKTGDEKELDITFPENYNPELAGKAVVFKVKVNDILETELPALDDEFAKDVSEFDKLSDYKVAIMEELVKQRTKAVEEDFGFQAIKMATETMTVIVPEEMISERMGAMINEYDRNLMQQGMRLEEYMRMVGMDPSSFQQMLRPQAEAQVKTELLLSAIVEAEKIDVTEEEMEKSIADIAAAYNMTPEQIKMAVPMADMEADMRKKKANDIIMESAVPVAAVADDAAVEEKPKKKAAAKKPAAKKTAEPAPEEAAEKTEE